VEPAVTAVGGPDSDFGEGKLWYGGDQTVHLLVVLYSGKTLSTAAVTFYGCEGFDETITADEFPGDVVFSAADDTEPLWDYESCDADDDVFEVGGALYDDGTSAAVLNGTLASGPNGMTHNIDEVGPWDVPLELTDQVIEWESGTACCSNNWVGADYRSRTVWSTIRATTARASAPRSSTWAPRVTTRRTSSPVRRWRRPVTPVWT
jgi:hypothetical protein